MRDTRPPAATFTATTNAGQTVHAIANDDGHSVLATACGRFYWREMPRDEHDRPGFPEGFIGSAAVTCRQSGCRKYA